MLSFLHEVRAGSFAFAARLAPLALASAIPPVSLWSPAGPHVAPPAPPRKLALSARYDPLENQDGPPDEAVVFGDNAEVLGAEDQGQCRVLPDIGTVERDMVGTLIASVSASGLGFGGMSRISFR